MANNNKHTGPNVPALRFPEFSGEWIESKLGDIADFSKGAGISKDQRSEEGNPCILYGELYTRYKSEVITNVFSKTALPDSELVKSKANDIIIPASGETAEDIATARCVPFDNILLGGDLNIIRLHEQDGKFFSYQLNGVRKYDIATVAQGVSVVHLHAGDLKGITVKYPSHIAEQEKISQILGLIDDRIATQSKIIEELTALRSALHQGIMSTGLEDGSWRMQTLDEVLSERTELNNEGHAVHSVSVSKGIVNQIEYLGRSFAAKDTSRYHVAYPGDVVYTKSPTGEFPYGIVKQSQIPIKAALSPLYGVYVPITQEIGYIIHNHFLSAKNALNYLHPLIQKGAKNTINITNQRFLQNSMPLPSSNSVARLYFKTIKTLSDKIDLEISILHQLQIQKRKLLNDMFI